MARPADTYRANRPHKTEMQYRKADRASRFGTARPASGPVFGFPPASAHVQHQAHTGGYLITR